MALTITTHYKQALTSTMLNEKINTLAGGNAIIEGFAITKQENLVTIGPGKCIVQGAIIENDSDIQAEIPVNIATNSELIVAIKYSHIGKSAIFYVTDTIDSNDTSILKIATITGTVNIESKMRTMFDLSQSLNSMKDNLLSKQELEYEGENILSVNSIDGATSDLKIKGQTILNVAPIKDEVEVYADLQAAKNGSAKFDNTGNGIIDGVNIKGKTYQNVYGEAFSKRSNINTLSHGQVTAGGYYKLIANGSFRNAFLNNNGLLKRNTEYTIIMDVKTENLIGNKTFILSDTVETSPFQYTPIILNGPGIYVIKVKTKDVDMSTVIAFRGYLSQLSTSGELEFRVVLLEGNHTANPDLPDYFEGIVGVGNKSKNLLTNNPNDWVQGQIETGGTFLYKTTAISMIKKLYIKPNTAYSFTSYDGKYRAYHQFRKDGSYISDSRWISTKEHIFTSDSEAAYIEITVRYGNSGPITPYDLSSSFQLEEGSISTPYKDYYDANKIEIKSCGKNLCDNSKNKRIDIDFSTGEDKTSSKSIVSEFIKIPKNRVLNGKVFLNMNEISINTITTRYFDNDKNYILAGNFEQMPTNAAYIRLRCMASEGFSFTSKDDVSFMLVNESSIPTAYEPYTESSITHYLSEPLMSLPGGICDEIIENKLIRRVGKTIFNGSENWKYYDDTNENFNEFWGYIPGGEFYVNNTVVSNLPQTTNHRITRTINGTIYIRLPKSYISSLESAKQWLLLNPITVYFPLTTPIITPIDSDVVLPNGVHDEVIENKAVRKIREVILNGSEDWEIGSAYSKTPVFRLMFDDGVLSESYSIVPDMIINYEMPIQKYDILNTTKPTNPTMFYVKSDKLNAQSIFIYHPSYENNLVGFKAWLVKNPTKVWYQLATPYETPADNNIVLPNGVRDEIVDGKVYRKIKKTVFNGSEDWKGLVSATNTWGTPNSTAFMLNLNDIKIYGWGGATGCVISDIFPGYNGKVLYDSIDINEGICNDSGRLNIRILKSRLSTLDIAGFKKWLSENPITVWYEVATPYFDTNTNPQLKSFKTQTNIIGNTLVPTPLNIESYGYRKPAIIKPSTKYTISFNNKFTDSTYKNIKVDLGGSIGNVTANNTSLVLTLTTPAILVHNELRISGYGIKISKVMCSEGDVYRKFIDGMASAGDNKNLLDYKMWKLTNPTQDRVISCNNGRIELLSTVKAVRYSAISFDFYDLIPGKQYTASVEFETTTKENDNLIRLVARKDSKNNHEHMVSGQASSASGRKVSFTAITGLEYHRVELLYQYNEAVNQDNVVTTWNWQLEEALDATAYEPYYDGSSVKISSNNKNLLAEDFFISNKFYLHNNCKYELGENSLKVYNNNSSKSDCYAINYFDLLEGYNFDVGVNYILSFDLDVITHANGNVLYLIQYLDKNLSGGYNGDGLVASISGFVADKKRYSLPFKLREKRNGELCLRLNCDNAGGALTISNIQIEKAPLPTPYISHKSDSFTLNLPEPLRSLPSGVCDTIEKIDGQYVVVRRCKEVIFNGTENWVYHSEIINNSRVILDLPDMIAIRDSTPIYILCDKLDIGIDSVAYLNSEVQTNVIFKRTDDTRASLYLALLRSDAGIIDGDSNSVRRDKIKGWLSRNNITVIYQLAQPTVHPLNYVKLPNGVADEVSDGKLIRKVGKVVFDGSEAWTNIVNPEISAVNTMVFSFSGLSDIGVKGLSKQLVCDTFDNKIWNSGSPTGQKNDTELVSSAASESFLIVIKILRNKLTTQDVSGFKKWLSENPTTVWYELVAPIEEEYVSPNLNLDTFNGTTHVTSNTLVPAIINTKIPTNTGAVIKNDITRIEKIEDMIDSVILPTLVESHYQKTLLEFDYDVLKMLE